MNVLNGLVAVELAAAPPADDTGESRDAATADATYRAFFADIIFYAVKFWVQGIALPKFVSVAQGAGTVGIDFERRLRARALPQRTGKRVRRRKETRR